MNKRPIWDFPEITEARFKLLKEFGCVEKVWSGYTMLSEDTSHNWIRVQNGAGNEINLPLGWESVLRFTGDWTNPGMFKLTYLGERMAIRLETIQSFDKAATRDLATYRRLKAKFEGMNVDD